MQNIRLTVICGLPRSGTTYVGKIVSKSPKVEVIHEPFNPEWGIKRISCRFPYIDAERGGENEITNLCDKVVNFKADWLRISSGTKCGYANKNSPYLKKFIKKHIGGRLAWNWQRLKLKEKLGLLPETICWKDSYTTFLSAYLAKKFKAKIICLIRHPGAVLYSRQKQKWKCDMRDMLCQHELLKQYGYNIPEKHWKLAKNNDTASLAILWKIMVRFIDFTQKKIPELLTIRHEDLCNEPIKYGKKICNHLEIMFTENNEKYIIKTSYSKKKRNIKLHTFVRNSKEIVDYWRNKITTQDERLLKDIIKEDINTFYTKW